MEVETAGRSQNFQLQQAQTTFYDYILRTGPNYSSQLFLNHYSQVAQTKDYVKHADLVFQVEAYLSWVEQQVDYSFLEDIHD